MGGGGPELKHSGNINKKGNEGGKGDKSQKKGNGKGAKAESQAIAEEPPTVQEFPMTHSIDSEICVLDGTNIRQLRDVLGLRPAGIIEPAQRLRKQFWKEISKLVLEACDRNILT